MSTRYYAIRYMLLSFGMLFCFLHPARCQRIPDSLIRQKTGDIHSPLKRLLTLEPHVFKYDASAWKDLRLPRGNQFGFSPENVEAVFPELVDDYSYNYLAGKNLVRQARIKTVQNQHLVPVLVASIKELQAELEKLKADVQLLKRETTMTRSD